MKKILSSLALIAPLLASGQVPAFPGAEGFGKFATGWRGGGTVYPVTSLNDAGTGTLREALQATGQRTIVFYTSGTITLSSNIVAASGNFAVVGWTAPGDGIIVKGAAIQVNANNWMVLGMTILPGDATTGPDPSDRDAIRIQSSCNVGMVAFCDLGWWIDANQMFDGPDSISFIYNMSFEPLNDNLHPKGPHADHLNIVSGTNIFLGWNAFIHGKARMPQMAQSWNNIVGVNNLIYNYQSAATEVQPTQTGLAHHLDWMGHVYINGPDSTIDQKEITLTGTTGTKIYLRRNRGISGTNWQMVSGDTILYKSLGEVVLSKPSGYREVLNASNIVRDHVLDYAGARIPAMASIEARLRSDVRIKAGRVKDCVGPVPKTIYWPDVLVNETLPGNILDSVIIPAPIGGLTDDRYNTKIIQIDYDNNNSWDDTATVIGTDACCPPAPGEDPGKARIGVNSPGFSNKPESGDRVRIWNPYSDTALATASYPTVAVVTPYTDSDSDKIPDTIEDQIGTDKNSAASPDGTWHDKDGDGFTNIEEWWISKIPVSRPKLPKR